MTKKTKIEKVDATEAETILEIHNKAHVEFLEGIKRAHIATAEFLTSYMPSGAEWNETHCRLRYFRAEEYYRAGEFNKAVEDYSFVAKHIATIPENFNPDWDDETKTPLREVVAYNAIGRVIETLMNRAVNYNLLIMLAAEFIKLHPSTINKERCETAIRHAEIRKDSIGAV